MHSPCRQAARQLQEPKNACTLNIMSLLQGCVLLLIAGALPIQLVMSQGMLPVLFLKAFAHILKWTVSFQNASAAASM